MKPALDSLPEGCEFHPCRFGGQSALESPVNCFQVSLHRGAPNAAFDMSSHALILGESRLGVEAALDKFSNTFAIAHRNEFNLSCSFLRA